MLVYYIQVLFIQKIINFVLLCVINMGLRNDSINFLVYIAKVRKLWKTCYFIPNEGYLTSQTSYQRMK